MALTYANDIEAVPCLQVGFVLYKHMHISYHQLVIMLVTHQLEILVNIELHLLTDCTAVHIEPEVEINI